MKFYILVHRKLEYLKNHAATIPFKDQVVVINSLNNDFVDQASAYCQENSIEYYVTESNGKPAMGKNAVIRLFLESDNDYMVQVDGDDQITEYGYKLYTDLAKSENAPDIVCLKNQWMSTAVKFRVDENGNNKCIQYERIMPWTRTRNTHERMLNPFFHYEDIKVRNWPKDMWPTIYEWAKVRVEFEKFCWDYGNGSENVREIFTRMVFYSRKAAELVNFDERLVIGEDTFEFLRMKNMSRKGIINMVTHDEMPQTKLRPGKKYPYSYVYRQLDHESIVASRSYDPVHDRVSYAWIIPIMDYISDLNLREEYKSIKHWNLPEYKRLDI